MKAKALPVSECSPGGRVSTLGGGSGRASATEATLAQAEAKAQYRDVCAKCGARRVDEQIGLEKLHDCELHSRAIQEQTNLQPCGECFVCHLVAVFQQVRRILRDDGLLVLNLGDSYGGGGRKTHGTRIGAKQGTNRASAAGVDGVRLDPEGLASGNLLGIPWRVALALQADGWILRSDCPWVKRSPMPESVQNRPAKSLEYVFLLSKTQRCFWDMEAVKQKAHRDPHPISKKMLGMNGDLVRSKEAVGADTRNFRNSYPWFQSIQPPHGLVGVGDELVGIDPSGEGFSGAHFAAFPTWLVKPFILAGTSQAGCCPKCGAGWKRQVSKDRKATRPGKASKVRVAGKKIAQEPGRDWTDESRYGKSTLGSVVGNRDPERHVTSTRTLGWQPGCSCDAGEPVPAVVLDPFLGTGTVLLVAQRHGRAGIGIELSEEYLKLAEKRLRTRGKSSREPAADPRRGKGFGLFS